MTCIKCHKDHPHMIQMCAKCYQVYFQFPERQVEIILEQNTIFWKLLLGDIPKDKVSESVETINKLQKELKRITK